MRSLNGQIQRWPAKLTRLQPSQVQALIWPCCHCLRCTLTLAVARSLSVGCKVQAHYILTMRISSVKEIKSARILSQTVSATWS